MPSPIVHFQLASSDPEATEAFFRDVFDWSFTASGATGSRVRAAIETGHRQVEPNDIYPSGTLFQLPEGAPAYTALYIRVADLDETLKRAQERGARVVLPRTRNPGGTDLAIITTPQGLVVGIVQL